MTLKGRVLKIWSASYPYSDSGMRWRGTIRHEFYDCDTWGEAIAWVIKRRHQLLIQMNTPKRIV